VQESSQIKLKNLVTTRKCKKNEFKINVNLVNGSLVFILQVASNERTEGKRNMSTFTTRKKGERNAVI
jgi:hypothetical protein